MGGVHKSVAGISSVHVQSSGYQACFVAHTITSKARIQPEAIGDLCPAFFFIALFGHKT